MTAHMICMHECVAVLVEIEHYFVAYFDHITVFKTLQHSTSIKGVFPMHYVVHYGRGSYALCRLIKQAFFQLFAQGGGGGGQNEIVWIIGGTSVYPCAKHVAN